MRHRNKVFKERETGEGKKRKYSVFIYHLFLITRHGLIQDVDYLFSAQIMPYEVACSMAGPARSLFEILVSCTIHVVAHLEQSLETYWLGFGNRPLKSKVE